MSVGLPHLISLVFLGCSCCVPLLHTTPPVPLATLGLPRHPLTFSRPQMKNADYFSNYVTEDFTTYINRKRKSTCHGNHIEMQAMAEMYNRPVEVYQYGTGASTLRGPGDSGERVPEAPQASLRHWEGSQGADVGTVGVFLWFSGLPQGAGVGLRGAMEVPRLLWGLQSALGIFGVWGGPSW